MLRQVVFLLLGLLFLNSWGTEAQTVTGPRGEVFAVRVVAGKLSDPWEVAYGPDHHLWVTEAKGYRVSRIDPATGAQTVLLDLSKARNFPRYDKVSDRLDGGKPWPQGGLMGLALHPRLLSGKPYVYLAYVHRFAGADRPGKGGAPNYGGFFFTTRLVRYEYDARAQTLSRPLTLCDTIPGSSDHNGGRLLVAPVDGRDYVFYSVGDLGAGQFDNGGRPNRAQHPASYEGKILRFNAEPDADPGRLDQWIPNDNPFAAPPRQSAVWSTGHRNAQGLAYAVVGGTGRLYASEHGPYSDDEINLVEKGRNYGHPLVLGLADGNYDGLAAGASDRSTLPGPWHTTYPTIGSEQANARTLGATYRDPIKSLYPLPHSFLRSVLTRTITNDPNQPEWPSEAPSSLAVYTSAGIPGWQASLLVPTLKKGKLIRLQLNAAGDRVVGDTLNYFPAPMRYRDVAIAPDGRKLYLAVDSASVTSGPSREDPKGSICRGCILEFAYQSGGSSQSSKASGAKPLPSLELRPAGKPAKPKTSPDKSKARPRTAGPKLMRGRPFGFQLLPKPASAPRLG